MRVDNLTLLTRFTMGDIITLPIVLSSLPTDWKTVPSRGKSISRKYRPLQIYSSDFCYMAAFVERRLIPAGPAYLAHVLRTVHDLSFEEHDKHIQEEQQRRRNLEQEADEEDDFGVGDEQETEDLLSLDPKEWKVGRRSFSSTAIVLCPIIFFIETRSLCCPWSVPS
jgi:DnaJ homolog subfamily C member 2